MSAEERVSVNTQILIDAVVQQTVVFIAQLATAGGVRAPLARVANEVFLGLTRELQNQGVKKKVIADMFGMALRTYHRRVRELGRSRTDKGQTLWEAVLGFLKEHEPVSVTDVRKRFRHDDPEILGGVLNDLVASGLAYRAGRGESSVVRLADEADFAHVVAHRREADQYVVWLTVYRNGPVSAEEAAHLAHLTEPTCRVALDALLDKGVVHEHRRDERIEYTAESFEVPFGTEQGWEAAVLDHFQALVAAVTRKLALGSVSAQFSDVVGGSTWSLDVWDGHPLAAEALATLTRVRTALEDLRRRIDEYNADHTQRGRSRRVVVYTGQYVDADEDTASHKDGDESVDAAGD
jgi:hypothetical protein